MQFVYYDFNSPLDLPSALIGQCAGIVLDPPYLNADCLKGFTSTVMMLRKAEDIPLMLCTGAVMADTAAAMLGVKQTAAAIVHEGSRLSNPFACFVANIEPSELGGYAVEES